MNEWNPPHSQWPFPVIVELLEGLWIQRALVGVTTQLNGELLSLRIWVHLGNLGPTDCWRISFLSSALAWIANTSSVGSRLSVDKFLSFAHIVIMANHKPAPSGSQQLGWTLAFNNKVKTPFVSSLGEHSSLCSPVSSPASVCGYMHTKSQKGSLLTNSHYPLLWIKRDLFPWNSCSSINVLIFMVG